MALVSWAWKTSLLASSASKNVGEGLSGEKAPALPLRTVSEARLKQHLENRESPSFPFGSTQGGPADLWRSVFPPRERDTSAAAPSTVSQLHP